MDKAEMLWEIEQIKQLKALYFRLLDTKKWKEMRQLFTDDMHNYFDEIGEPTSSEPINESADEFMKMVENLLEHAVTVHHGHMPEIELTSDRTAKGIWSMYDTVEGAHGHSFTGFGHYHETYVKGDDGKWRIKDLRVTRLRVDGNPVHPEDELLRPEMK